MILTVFVGFAAAQRPNNLIVWVFGVLIALILVSGIISGAMILRLRVSRIDVRRAAVGEPFELRYKVENKSKFRAAFALRIEDICSGKKTGSGFSDIADPAFAWLVRVGAGESQVCDAVLWPRRRGVMELNRIRIASRFPFGLVERYVDFESHQRVLVQPCIHPVKGDLLQAVSKGELGGIGMSRRPGPGEDFYSVREFKPGDSVRHVAWKRLGLSDELLVIQRSVSPPPRVRVLLDLSTPTSELKFDASQGMTASELEERAIIMTASVLAAAENNGIDFGLTVLGFSGKPLPLRRGYWHRERALASLAEIDLTKERLKPEAMVSDDNERAAVVVMHPARIDPRVAPEGSWHWSATRFEELLNVKSVGPSSRTGYSQSASISEVYA